MQPIKRHGDESAGPWPAAFCATPLITARGGDHPGQASSVSAKPPDKDVWISPFVRPAVGAWRSVSRTV